MYYEIEAVRWNSHGHICEVRWRAIDIGGDGVIRGEPTVVPVLDAAQACKDHDVRVYVPGSAGRFFRMKACAQGLDAEADEAGTPLRERLAHLPGF